MGIASDFVWVKEETRTNLKVVDPQEHTNTDINEPGTPVEPDVIEAVYNIGICERISPDEIKNRLIMVDNIGKDLLNARFIVNAASRVKKVEYDPIYDADFLRNMNVFVSVIVVTVQVYNA